MTFWDSSALVTLCIDQPRSEDARRKFSADPEVVVWWATAIEIASAIARLRRDKLLVAADERAAHAVLSELRSGWYEIQPSDGVREQALRAMRLHPLRAADAMQLGAALEWAGPHARGAFVSFDDRLSFAAQREGFATD